MILLIIKIIYTNISKNLDRRIVQKEENSDLSIENIGFTSFNENTLSLTNLIQKKKG